MNVKPLPYSRGTAFFIVCGLRYGIVVGLVFVFILVAIRRPGEIQDRMKLKMAAIQAAIRNYHPPVHPPSQTLLQPVQTGILLWARSMGQIIDIQQRMQSGRMTEAETEADHLLRSLGLDPARYKTRGTAIPFPLLLVVGILFLYNSLGYLLMKRVPLQRLAIYLASCDLALTLVILSLEAQQIGPLEQLLLLPGFFSLAVLFGPLAGLLALVVYSGVEGIGAWLYPAPLAASLHLIIIPLIFAMLLFYIGYVTQQERKASTALLENALLEEKQSLARELHDGLGADVATVLTGLELARKQLGQHPEAAAGVLGKVSRAGERLYGDLRDMTHLYRKNQEAIPLSTRIESYVGDLAFSSRLEINVRREGDERFLSAPSDLALFRVVQEALHNVVSHADASSCSLELHYGEQDVELQVTDNGTGFDPGEAADKRGMGLRNMKERVERLGGTLDIQSQTGKGTVVMVTLPYR